MIRILCVGKLKERYFLDAVNEYIKRLSRYVEIELVEIPDSHIDDPIVALDKEKEGILKKLTEKDYVITLEIEGTMLTSLEFSRTLDQTFLHHNPVTFIIGGSFGIHSQIKQRANLRLSFSKMTFPHQLFRIILLEQIYRGFKILNHERYHK